MTEKTFPIEWVRGIPVGRGSSATVHLALPKSNSKSESDSDHMVVKSSTSDSLINEGRVLHRLGHRCPQIIRCFGHDNNNNLLLEYASGGSLSDHLRRSPENRLSEPELRNHTSSILTGLQFIHDSGFAHCDIKLQNVLLFADGQAKIADFGLAKEIRNGEGNRGGFELRGTPLYMAPEVVAGADVDAPADVWALGCAVVEMATGKPAWRCGTGCGVPELLCRIGVGSETPEIPECLSDDGKNFVSKCLIKDPRERWTARMLLDHPFVLDVKTSAASPNGPFDFPDWTAPSGDVSSDAFWSPNDSSELCSASIMERIEKLAGSPVQEMGWSGSDDINGWVIVR